MDATAVMDTAVMMFVLTNWPPKECVLSICPIMDSPKHTMTKEVMRSAPRSAWKHAAPYTTL